VAAYTGTKAEYIKNKAFDDWGTPHFLDRKSGSLS